MPSTIKLDILGERLCDDLIYFFVDKILVCLPLFELPQILILQ